MDNNPAFDRIYAQLYPEAESLEHILQVQAALEPQDTGRSIPAKQIHMSIIHFGIIEGVRHSIVAASGSELPLAEYLGHIARLADGWEDALRQLTLRLEPTGFVRLGQRGGTFALAYRPTHELLILHQHCLALLIQFFKACHIGDPVVFMREDPNFMHALSLTPHISLYKGYAGAEPEINLQTVWLHESPVRMAVH